MPVLIGVLAAVTAVVAAGARAPWREASAGALELAGFVVAGVGMLAYWACLSWPDWLPVAFPFDLSHHLTIIEYIQRAQHLPHDHALQPYLEVDYAPGAHIVAALLAGALGTSGLFVVQPLVALFVALKSGLLYVIVLRLQDGCRAPAIALVAVAFQAVAYGYFIQSFTVYGYLPQIIAEYFALAMLLALLLWRDWPTGRWLWAFAGFGCAAYVTWPLWVALPMAALAVLIWTARGMSARERLTGSMVAFAPIVVAAALFTLARLGFAARVVTISGGTIKPYPENFGVALLVLFVMGVAVGLRSRTLWPLNLFAAAAVAQTVALTVFNIYIGERTNYLGFKMFYLLAHLMLLYAAFAVYDFERVLCTALSPGGQRGVAWLVWFLPVGGLLLAWQNPPPLPPRRPYAALYAAGVWARDHLPAGCVDYLVNDNTEYYWLHTTVLGNSRETPRVIAMLRDSHLGETAAAYWQDSDRLPYAIVPDRNVLPAVVGAGMAVLYEAPPVVVIRHTASKPCAGDAESWYQFGQVMGGTRRVAP